MGKPIFAYIHFFPFHMKDYIQHLATILKDSMETSSTVD